jgi:hypothetical protein
MFGCIIRIRGNNPFIIESNNKVLRARFTQEPIAILSICPCTLTVFDTYTPGRPEHDADICLSCLPDLYIRNGGSIKIVPDCGASCEANDKYYSGS